MAPIRYSRRAVLCLGSTAFVGSLAGCSVSAIGQDQGIAIGDIVLRHYPPESHTVRLELERDGEFVTEVLYADLAENQKEIVQATWPSTPAVYRLYTVVEGPLATTDDQFDVFVNEFTSEDDRSEGKECSVIDIQIGAPPNPDEVVIGLKSPGPEGFGDCSNGPSAE